MKRRSALCWVLLGLGLPGCGLPAPEGVQRPGPAVERAAQPGDVDVLPPDPRPDADAQSVVEGFIDAQGSPNDSHAIARKYLAEGVTWDDAEARVFDPTRRTRPREVSPGVVQVSYDVVGRIRRDGTWLSERRTDVATYRLRRAGQTWRLTSVPAGLHLSERDRDRSFRSRSVHFLSAESPAGRLVAEPVFFPVTADPAQVLVERLLLGPSADLAPAVRSAFPPGTRLAGRVVTEGGTVTVDLDEGLQELEQAERRRLSAQLVWTLRELPTGFATLRLRAGGRPLLVDGRDEQRRDAWDEQAPDGLPPTVAMLFVRGRDLHSLGTGAVVPGDRPAVDDAAISPFGDRVAVLTRQGAVTTISTGPLAGPAGQRVRRGLATSPSWGSGEQGLWFVEGGRVALLPLTGNAVIDVPVDGPGRVTAIAVSRDGARVAVVRNRALLIGRIENAAVRPRIAGLRAVAPGVREVLDVVWEDATTVVVIGGVGTPERIPFRVSVDGASVLRNTRIGVDGSPTAVAAAAGQDLVVAAGGQLFRDTGRVFELLPRVRGTAPFYPG